MPPNFDSPHVTRLPIREDEGHDMLPVGHTEPFIFNLLTRQFLTDSVSQDLTKNP